MVTRIYTVTEFPVDLLTASDIDGQPLDLMVGKTYIARYVALGVQSVFKVLEVPSGTTVDASDPALLVRTFEDITIIPKTGLDIFAWSEGDGQLIINDTT